MNLTCKSLLSLCVASFLGASVYAQVPRPPQFVALAFDGSQSIQMWNETKDFANALEQKNEDLKFTYFISGVYWLSPETRKMYLPPKKNPGASDIGFGESKIDVEARIDIVNEVFDLGHEMASHANGHFDATAQKWVEADWEKEFNEFNKLIFKAGQNNGLKKELKFTPADVVGFRAPLLERASGLSNVLNKFHYRYDTSRIADRMDYWPEKKDGLWNFPLAPVVIAGTGKKTISMDYNFYYAQSKGVADTAHSAIFEEQMYNTYINYFKNNYNGNRAPIHIGHHFSKWNAGAYWRAMKRFAQEVCGQPEVKCVTYKELADYMDSIGPETVAAYKKADFEKGKAYTKVAMQPLDIKVALNADENSNIQALVSGMDSKNIKFHWEVNGKPTLLGKVFSFFKKLRGQDHLTLVGLNANGQEVVRTTRVVENDQDGNTVLSDKELELQRRCHQHNHDELE